MTSTVTLSADDRSVRTRSTTKRWAVAVPHSADPARLRVVLRTDNRTIADRELEKHPVAYLFSPRCGGELVATSRRAGRS